MSGRSSSIGATTYNQTNIAVDEDKVDASFEQEVFTSSFENEDENHITSTMWQLESFLGVSVFDKNIEHDDASVADAEADSEGEIEDDSTEYPSAVDAGVIEAEQEATPEGGEEKAKQRLPRDVEADANTDATITRLESEAGTGVGTAHDINTPLSNNIAPCSGFGPMLVVLRLPQTLTKLRRSA